MENNKEKQLVKSYTSGIWCYLVTNFFGAWLFFAPITFGYTSDACFWNDICIGLIVLVLSKIALFRKGWWAPWIICLCGIWLQFAPLLFWAPDPVIYLNDTLIGVLLISFSLLIPGFPGVVESQGHAIPPGWSYNPSSWMQRMPVITFACISWFISRYLAAYQLGYVDVIWDPMFGFETEEVLTSTISRSLPFPDAGLGALAYTLEAVLGCKGGEARWRTMPWIVLFFAFLVVPVGIVSIILVMLQPILVKAWCFLCLLTALCMLWMIVLTVDEMVAVIQFLYYAKRHGYSLWRVFWKGSDQHLTRTLQEDRRTPPIGSSPWKWMKAMYWGVSFSWNLAITAVLGVFLLCAPNCWFCSEKFATVDNIIGALIVVVSVIGFAEVARKLRYLLILFGGILVIFFTPLHLLIAIILCGLAFVSGPQKEKHSLPKADKM